jgi:hypothetical protein
MGNWDEAVKALDEKKRRDDERCKHNLQRESDLGKRFCALCGKPVEAK